MYFEFVQQFKETEISPMGVNGLVPLEGISVSNSRVKADCNCLLQIFALSRVTVFRIPFSLSVVIPNASFLRDFTSDQNFFTFSFFLEQSRSEFSVSKEKIFELCFQYASLMTF